jgi:signal transduction histidine kinase
MRHTHRLAWELRPPALGDLGLEMALQRYTVEWSEVSVIPVDFHTHGFDEQRLAPELETVLYRVTQEALTNIARHAQARQVSLLLECRADLVSLIIEDDGRGFDPQAAIEHRSASDRLGLLGMEERVKLAGGTVTIESSPGTGTTVYVRLPRRNENPGQHGGKRPGPANVS